MKTPLAHPYAAPARGRPDDRRFRLALQLDAVASGVLGLLAVIAAPALESLLGLPATFLRPTGIVLIAYAAAVGLVGAHSPVSLSAARAIVALNVLWVGASIVVAALGWLSPTTLGVAFILVQAGAVALLAELQYLGLRRVRSAVGEVARA